jgi:FlaA1/EpsC-like NDP-sugar epimerase
MRFLNKPNQIILDLSIFTAAYFAAFFIRFEGVPDPASLRQLLIFFSFIALARLICFFFAGVYNIAWRYISLRDVFTISLATLPVTLALAAGRAILPLRLQLFRIPLSVTTMEFLLVLIGTLSVRMFRRYLYEEDERKRFGYRNSGFVTKRVLLVGAGGAGNMAIRELLQRKDLGMDVEGFVDDDPTRQKKRIQGIEVLGTTEQIPALARKHHIDEAVITIASATSKDIRRIADICEKARIKVKIVPGLFEILDDKIKVSKIREIDIDDLLGRSLISFKHHLPAMQETYGQKKVLVTGAGGSIGSELCRQLSGLRPAEIILLDKDENSVYEIDYELRSKFKGLPVVPVIADIRQPDRIRALFGRHRPNIVFHAAAHKHVPLMEANATEAVLNNVFGTRTLSTEADKAGVEAFISISTDKAVNPTSVMGATKKVGEILIQQLAAHSATRFSCVRFGNVLGSRGSVVPLFRRQIAEGGPITITHPDVRRYFMSISEAVQLIIQAGTLGRKGEIFVLDMGKPIRIVDLAKDMIRLSGFAEDDLEIEYIGLRPGEKLYEEILVNEEKDASTHFDKIFIAQPIEIEPGIFFGKLDELIRAARTPNDEHIRALLRDMNIGYTPETPGPRPS